MRVVLAAALGHLVVDLHQGSLPVLLPLLRDSLGLSYALVTALVLLMQLGSSLLQPAVGLLADRWQVRWIAPVAFLLAGIGYNLILLGGYGAAALGIFLTGMGIAAYHPEGSRIVYYAAGHRRAWCMSVYAMGGNVGVTLAPLFTGFFVAKYGLPGVSGLLLLVAMPAAALFTLLRPSLYRQVPQRQGETKAATGAPGSWRQVAGPFLILLGTVVLRAWTHTSALTFIPLYYVSHLDLASGVGSARLTAYAAAGVAGAMAGGWVADRWSTRGTLILTLALAAGCLALFPRLEGLFSWVLMALAGAAVQATVGVTNAMGQALLPGHVGLASGLVLGATVGTGGVGTVILGLCADKWGMDTAMALLPLFPGLAVLGAVAFTLYTARRTAPAAGQGRTLSGAG